MGPPLQSVLTNLLGNMTSFVTFLMLVTVLVAQGKNDCDDGYEISPTGDGCCEVKRPYCCCDAPKCINVNMYCRFNETYVWVEHFSVAPEPVQAETIPPVTISVAAPPQTRIVEQPPVTISVAAPLQTRIVEQPPFGESNIEED